MMRQYSMRRKSLKHTVLVILCVALSGCEGLIVTAPNSNQNLEDFEVAWAWVDSVYPAFGFKQIDWNDVYLEYRPQAERALGDEIVQVLHNMLAELQDTHIHHTTNGGARFIPYVSPRLLVGRKKFSPQLLRTYFDSELNVAGKDGVEYGIINDVVGYIRITNFNEDGMMDDFPSVMDFVSETRGLIIDVRNNSGGEHWLVEAVVRMFIDSTMAWPLAFQSDGIRVAPWADMVPDTDHPHYEHPVVVLINGASLSSGELFPEVMKQLPNITVVGDTTAGAGCSDRGGYRGDRRLPSGKLIHIPTWCITRYDGVPWETVGVAPDIYVEQTIEDVLSGVDRQLEFAIEFLR